MKSDRAFVDVALEFCGWAEGEQRAPQAEAETARRLLAELYCRALELPAAVECPDEDNESRLDWQAVYRRFASLPFSYYGQVTDPLAVPPTDDHALGDLGDDLADIWSDLQAGRQLYAKGRREEAHASWRWYFDFHWGKHACDALQALHFWFQHAPK